VKSTLGLPSKVVQKGISTAASFGDSLYWNLSFGTFFKRSEMCANAASSKAVGILEDRYLMLHEVKVFGSRAGVSI
jgi:hypothetical protein